MRVRVDGVRLPDCCIYGEHGNRLGYLMVSENGRSRKVPVVRVLDPTDKISVTAAGRFIASLTGLSGKTLMIPGKDINKEIRERIFGNPNIITIGVIEQEDTEVS